MDLAAIVLLSAAALLAGLVDAMAGGGGLLTLPALLVAGLPVPLAVGTNKGQAVFGSGAALLAFWRADRLEPQRIPLLFFSGFAGSLGGAWAVTLLSPALLKPVVLVLLVLVAGALALRPSMGALQRKVGGRPMLRSVAIGAAIGAYDGFLGPGTGTFLILAFVTWLGDDLVGASAHAKVVNFASNLAALLLFAAKGLVRWELALPMAVAQALGATLGARLALRGGDQVLRWVVLAVVTALALKLGADVLR